MNVTKTTLYFDIISSKCKNHFCFHLQIWMNVVMIVQDVIHTLTVLTWKVATSVYVNLDIHHGAKCVWVS